MLYCCHDAQETQKTREVQEQHAQKCEAAIVFLALLLLAQ